MHEGPIGRRRRRGSWALLVTLVTLLTLLVGCGGGNTGGNTGGSTGGRGDGQAGSAAGVTEITVEGFEYGFDPDELTINRGDTVRIIFRNTGVLEHDWAVPDWNIRTPEIAGGEETTIEFTADQMGSVRFVCTVPGHETLGMVGTLNIR